MKIKPNSPIQELCEPELKNEDVLRNVNLVHFVPLIYDVCFKLSDTISVL